ncbi:MAG TPA: hypothetical protein VEX68_12205 [Bryobacteraceae bacterium]|nr:hypothetical protein [Bryobacteraceae bacterium]
MANRGFISMGAAGWHTSFDVLDRLLTNAPIGRLLLVKRWPARASRES